MNNNEILSIEVGDLTYNSDMCDYEFTAANRALFERLGAKGWNQCFELGCKIRPTLPEIPRPYQWPKLVIPEGWKPF